MSLRIFDGIAHHAERAFAIFRRRREVERVAAHAIAHDFSQDGRAAPFGKFQFFKDQNPGAFADHESVAIAIERAGSVRGIVIALRKRAHGGESADAHGRDAGFGAAADHDVGIAALNNPERIADGVGAGGAGRGRGGVRALCARPHGDVARMRD